MTKPRPAPNSELPLWPHAVQGSKLVANLEKYVAGLRSDPRHGNQCLFLDDVFLVYLLAFFNPCLRTLRTLEDFSQTRQAQKHLSIQRVCRSTLSDFNQLVDPSRLQLILAALRAELTQRAADSGRHAPDLNSVLRQVIAVDGTFLRAAADVAWAVGTRNQKSPQKRYRARLDLQVDVRTWLPEVIAVPDPGESEAEQAATTIQPGKFYLYDRGYISHDLILAHYHQQGETWQSKADFVLRLKQATAKNTIQFEVVSTRELTPEAQAAGILSDRIVRSPRLAAQFGFVGEFREIILLGSDGKELRLLTNCPDLGAEVIALLYRYRWQIELFFRWLKTYANFNHLISHSAGGVLLNFYVTLIGVMLMYLSTGYRPSKYMVALMSVVAQGATLEEILPILQERERQCERDRQSAARRRAKKQG